MDGDRHPVTDPPPVEPADGRTPLTPRSSSADETRSALIEAAIEHLNTHGNRRFRIEAVLHEANASSSSLYHHFGNRSGLLNAARAEMHRRLSGSADATDPLVLPDFPNPNAFLLWVAQRMTEVFDHPDRHALSWLQIDAVAEGRRQADPDATVEHERRQVIVHLLEQARERSLIDPALDLQAYAAFLQGLALAHTITKASFADDRRWLAIAIPAALTPLRVQTT